MISENELRRTGGGAFPHNGYNTGLSVRDFFAAAALQGVIAMHAGGDGQTPLAGKAARWAYEYADAMIAERAKREGQS